MNHEGHGRHGDPGRGAVHAPPSRIALSGGTWQVGGRELEVTAPRVMGILNLTPDSFSDGGELSSLEGALERARAMVEAGADFLDVGGESTRPGAEPVGVEEELRRVLPFIEAASGALSAPLSVDTRRSAVAREALRSGARIVNDVSGLNHDPRMAEVVAEEGASLVLSHMRGTPATMKGLAVYRDVVREVGEELRRSMDLAREAGIEEERIVLDPGIGFAKTGRQSLRILGSLATLGALGRPLLVGPSRKSFLGEVTGVPPKERVPGTIAACVITYLQGARIFRVHDVASVVQALAVTRAIAEASE